MLFEVIVAGVAALSGSVQYVRGNYLAALCHLTFAAVVFLARIAIDIHKRTKG